MTIMWKRDVKCFVYFVQGRFYLKHEIATVVISSCQLSNILCRKLAIPRVLTVMEKNFHARLGSITMLTTILRQFSGSYMYICCCSVDMANQPTLEHLVSESTPGLNISTHSLTTLNLTWFSGIEIMPVSLVQHSLISLQ